MYAASAKRPQGWPPMREDWLWEEARADCRRGQTGRDSDCRGPEARKLVRSEGQ